MTYNLEAEVPQLKRLVELCRSELGAEQVWLFGSRARGDNRPESDWDLLAILPDDAPEEALDPVNLWQIRRKSGLHADLIGVRRSEFIDSLDSVTTLSRIVHDEGVRIDV
jgi:uncharacterized protein